MYGIHFGFLIIRTLSSLIKGLEVSHRTESTSNILFIPSSCVRGITKIHKIYYSGIHTPCPCVFLTYFHTASELPNLKTLVIKFMNLLNMTKRAQIHEFYKKVKIKKIFIFQATVLKFDGLSVE